MRALLVIIANLCLPFVLWYLRNAIWRFLLTKKYGKDFNKDTRIPQMDIKKAIKLFSIGLLLLTLTLVSLRIFEEKGTFERLETVTKEYAPF